MMRDCRVYNSHGDSDEGIEQQRGGPGSDNSAFRMTLAGKCRSPSCTHPARLLWHNDRLNFCFLMKFRGSRFRPEAER